jgi:hypothetical protein
VTEAGHRYAHDLGDRRLRDLLLEEHPDLTLLAVELRRAERLFSRFPTQQPLEICDELLSFVATQLNIDVTDIEGYSARQHTVSDH